MTKGSQQSMRLEIRSRNVALTSQLHHHIERRIGQALDRFEHYIRRISIVLVDVNGPKGGPDKVCRLTVVLTGRDRVAAIESGPNAFRIVDRVADRVKRRVSSALERVRRFDATRTIRTAENS